MIFKRTKDLTSARRLVQWASAYQDETVKHKGADLGDLGVKLGRDYFTLRPPGHLSMHGYPTKEVAIVQLEKQCTNNAAVVEWLRQHCKKQKEKERKVLGIRAVASMNPDKCQDLIKARVDVDRVLEAGLENTFKLIQEKFYPGDELGYLMGIHHDRMAGERFGQFEKPNFHAHLVVLPQTRNGLRLSMSGNNFPMRDEQAVDMLAEFRLAFNTSMNLVIGAAQYEQFVARQDPLVAAKVQEASAKVIQEWAEKDDMSPDVARNWAVDRFKYFLAQSPEELRSRLTVWEREIETVRKRPAIEVQRETQKDLKSLFAALRQPFINRGAAYDELLEKLRRRKQPKVNFAYIHGLHCWIEPGTEPTEERNSLAADIEAAVRKMELRESAGRINLVGECARAELHLSASMQPSKLPDWFQILRQALTHGTLAAPAFKKVEPDPAPEKPTPEPGQTPPM